VGQPPDDAPRLAWWEVLGAWLRLWTPPRGAAVPPVPWRWVAAGALGAAGVVAVVLLAVAPAVDEAKQTGAAERARERAEARTARAARLRRDQRATVVRLTRAPLVAQIEAAVAAGIQARIRSGELRARRLRAVRCTDPRPYGGGRLAFDCLAGYRVPRTFPPVTVGLPVVAVVAKNRRSFAWCKINPIAGEGQAFRQVRVPLPRACAR
jgi:hypothetical protein